MARNHSHLAADLRSMDASPSTVVGIGASAGGLRAIGTLLAALPADFPAPIVIVQHLSAHFSSVMAHILMRETPLNVKQAEEGDRLQPGWVYIAPPGKHLLVCSDQSLHLSVSAKIHYARPSVDVLFKSLAESMGACAVGVVLTGGDGDGAEGIQAIKAAGGVTICQDQPSSKDPSMPRSAAATGAVDFVLPLTEVAPVLVSLLHLQPLR